MSDLTDLLADPDFRTGDYVVTRRAAPTFTDGVADAFTTTTLTTGWASLQPMEGADLVALGEGFHASDTRRLFTTAALRLVPVPDLLTIANPDTGTDETWRVVGFDPHTGLGGSHRVVYLARGATP